MEKDPKTAIKIPSIPLGVTPNGTSFKDYRYHDHTSQTVQYYTIQTGFASNFFKKYQRFQVVSMKVSQRPAASFSPVREALSKGSVGGLAPALSGVTAQSDLPAPNTVSKAVDIALPMNNFRGNLADT